MQHYLRLYISSFAFQAHIQRAGMPDVFTQAVEEVNADTEQITPKIPVDGVLHSFSPPPIYAHVPRSDSKEILR